ncbi:MAG: hypothetical protein KJ015_32840 [Myxococcales bacterium]|nr:hypothetical protein [Sorangiineae bacterium PRO1]MCL4754982.1 hypothetical protein [Myxococcales bacterium]
MSGQTKFAEVLEALAAIRRDLQVQDEHWARAKADLLGLGDVELALSELPTFVSPAQPPPGGIRG